MFSKTSKFALITLLAIAVWLSLAGSLMAQSKGSITGTVADPTGSVVPGVQVTLLGVDSQVKLETKSDATGSYGFSVLNFGVYTLTATAPSFKTYVQSKIEVNQGEYKRLDIVLTLGQITQQVEVTGTADVIETREASYGNVVDTKTLAQLPLQIGGAKRDPTMFEETLPGYQGGAGFTSNFNGSIGTYSELLVDGVMAECNPAVLGGCLRGSMSAEAIGEFKVADAVGADQGFTSGVVVTMVSKSGTNTLHGAAYEYFRNEALDSRTFFQSDVSKARRNEFGFTLGGPVYIPKVYNGKNKTFFFFNMGWFRYLTSAPGTVYTMPIDAYKQGDFSSLLGSSVGTDALGRPVFAGEIYNPATTRSDGAGGFIRDGFGFDAVTGAPLAGLANKIPSTMFSTVSKNFQAYLPPPQTSALTNNWVAGGGSGSSPERHFSVKIDHSTENHHVAAFFWNSSNTNLQPWALPNIFAIRTFSYTKSYNSRLNWTWMLGSNIVNDAIVGLDRIPTYTTGGYPDSNEGAALIGQPNPLGPCLPAIHVPGFFTGTQTEFKCGQGESDTNWRFSDNLTIQKGRHTLKFGGNYVHWNANFPVVTNGGFTFLPGQTGLPGTFLGNTGLSYASFLLGGVDNAAVQGGQYQSGRAFVIGVYGQDEWRVNDKLTLTLGLRYDAQPFPLHSQDQISQWDPTVPNPVAGGIPGGLTFAGFGSDVNGFSRLGIRRLAKGHYSDRNFGPRLGFAYRLRPSTSIRGSWGMYWGPVVQQMAGFGAVIQQGFFPTLTRESGDGFSAPFNWDAGFPLGSGNLSGNFDPSGANGSHTSFFGKDAGRPPAISMAHFSIQQELPGKVLVDFLYFGQWAHGIIALGPDERNQIDYKIHGSKGDLLAADAYSPEAVAAGIQVPWTCGAGDPVCVPFAGTVAQALRPFPQYLGINNEGGAISWSTYNSFQVKAQKHFSDGLSFLIGYTISKSISDINTNVPGYFAAASQDAYNHRAEKSLSNIDIPRSLIFNYTYELPVGPGKKFLNNNNPISKYVLGGWSIAGVHTYNSGFPLAISSQLTLPTMSAGALSPAVLRPDYTGSPIRTGKGCGGFDPATDLYLNASAFQAPAPWSFGNVPRTLPSTRSCGYSNENFSISKWFRFAESGRIQIGGNFFNLFNRHPWGIPDVNFSSASFGQMNSVNAGRSIQLNARIEF